MSFRDPRNRSNKETCVDREAIMSQFRVWPFLSTIIMTFGELNKNPGSGPLVSIAFSQLKTGLINYTN